MRTLSEVSGLVTSSASFIAVRPLTSRLQSKAGSLLAQTEKEEKRPKMSQLGLISLMLILGTCVRAIDLTRLYDQHNKREGVMGKIFY